MTRYNYLTGFANYKFVSQRCTIANSPETTFVSCLMVKNGIVWICMRT